MKILLTVLFTLIVAAQLSYAQCDSTSQGVKSGVGISMHPLDANGVLDETRSVDLDDFGPSFAFYYSSDSVQMRFEFGEFFLNQKKIYLSNWCRDRMTNWDDINDDATADWTAAEMRARSGSKIFPVSAGDTVQFYRTYWWIDDNNDTKFDWYVNDHPIGYSVELIDTSDGSRVLLLDTADFSTTTPSDKPCIYSWYPALSRVRGFVPSGVSANTDVIVQVNMYDNDGSPRPFVRVDRLDLMQSDGQLSTSNWTYYNDSIAANIDCGSSPSCDITAATSSSPKGVTVTLASPTHLDNVTIIDVYGAQQWTSSVPMASNPTTVATGAGLFIVIGRDHGAIVCTRNILVP